jgi:hypothetical protein
MVITQVRPINFNDYGRNIQCANKPVFIHAIHRSVSAMDKTKSCKDSPSISSGSDDCYGRDESTMS